MTVWGQVSSIPKQDEKGNLNYSFAIYAVRREGGGWGGKGREGCV